MKDLIVYWGPFIDKVATVKAILNSAYGINRYSKKYKSVILNAAGEWNNYKGKVNTEICDLENANYINTLPKFSYLKSRISYLIIFIRSFFKLKKYLIEKTPKYLIIHLIVSLPLILFLIFKFETKLCLRISGLPKFNFFRKILWKICNKKIFKVFCPTIATLNKLKKENIFDHSKLHYLPDPIISVKEIINKKNSNENLDENFEKNNIILVGRLTKQKNFKLFINSFQQISEKFPDLKANIIGEGELKSEISNLIKSKKLESKIKLIGFKENIFKYYKNSKIFVLSSLWEDPGFVLVEAGFLNLTVISSDCPNGPLEILDNGSRGFLFKNNNINSLTNCLSKVLEKSAEEIINKKLLNKKNLKKYTIFSHYSLLVKNLTADEN